MSSLVLAFPPDPEPVKSKPRTPKRKSRTKVRRKGSKKRKGSRSRSAASSGSETGSRASTPRSESSRVSFDMVPSDIDEPPTKGNFLYSLMSVVYGRKKLILILTFAFNCCHLQYLMK